MSAKNMLASLMSSFDSEKDALLAQIRDGDGKVSFNQIFLEFSG